MKLESPEIIVMYRLYITTNIEYALHALPLLWGKTPEREERNLLKHQAIRGKLQG